MIISFTEGRNRSKSNNHKSDIRYVALKYMVWYLKDEASFLCLTKTLHKWKIKKTMPYTVVHEHQINIPWLFIKWFFSAFYILIASETQTQKIEWSKLCRTCYHYLTYCSYCSMKNILVKKSGKALCVYIKIYYGWWKRREANYHIYMIVKVAMIWIKPTAFKQFNFGLFHCTLPVVVELCM